MHNFDVICSFYLTQRTLTHLLVHCSNVGVARLCLARARSQGLQPGPPGGWQAPQSLSHHVLPPKACISWKLGSGTRVRVKP